MKVLAFDTTATALVVGLAESGVPRAELAQAFTRAQGPQHARLLLPAVAQLLAAQGWQGRQLDAVGVTVGPGTFTGIRIGLVTAKLLASAWQIPVVPLAVPEALAHSLGPSQQVLAVALQAHRQRVFWAAYDWQGGLLSCLQEPVRMGLTDAKAATLALRQAGRPVTLIGDAAWLLDPEALPARRMWLSGGLLASLACQRLQDGAGLAPHAVLPLYLAEPEIGARKG